MEKVEKFRDFVKGQAEFHLRMANRHREDPRRSELHAHTADTFNELYDFLDSLLQEQNKERQRLSLAWDEIANLPPELVTELSVSDADRAEFNVLSAIENAGGVASLDRILVGYYRLTGDVMKRQQMINRIYRMSQKGLLFPVPGRKGVYALNEMSEEDAARLA